MKVKILFILLVYSFSGLSQDGKTNDEITALFYKGYNQIYNNKDSAFYFLNKALTLAEENKDYNTQLQILDYNIFVSGYYYDMKNYRNNLNKVEFIISSDSLSNKLKDLRTYENQFLFNKGNYFYKLGDYLQAKNYFIEIHQVLSKKGEDHLSEDEINILLSVYDFLASIYKNTGKYDLAELYYRKSISTASKLSFGTDLQITLAPTKLLLSQLYINMGEFEKANILLEEILHLYTELYKTEKVYKNNLVTVYQTLVKSTIEEGKYERSLAYLKECDQITKKDDPFFKQSLLLYAKVFSNLNKDQEALDFYDKALSAYEEYRQFKPHIDIANVYAELSRFYLSKSNFSKGLRTIDKAINAAGTNITTDSINSSLKKSSFFSNRQLLELLDLKNQHLILAYDETGKRKYLDKALNTNNLILLAFQLLKKEFNSKLDKGFLLEKVNPIFNGMLDITFKAYQLNPSDQLLEAALNISEKNKDILLLDAIRDVNAINFNQVPQKVMDTELIYKSDINITEKAIFNNDNPEAINELNEKLFQLKGDYYEFLDTLSKKYPSYYNLKYKEQHLSLKKIRAEILSKEKLIISYTVAEDYLYTIAINKSERAFVRIPFSTHLSDSIRTFYSMLSKPSLNDRVRLKSQSQQLFSNLLNPILKDFTGKELIIIQSGILHYIPFEALIDENGEYLLETKTLSYNSSLSSLLELKSKKVQNNGKLLAFAPTFENESKSAEIDTKLSPLLYNTEEVNNLNSHITSDIYTNKFATIATFNHHAANYNVIHLATHATANDEFPDYSYLAFSETDSLASTLFIKDLYNFKINAQMVTLSACQTGIGKLQKGEGMISMSKGFYYAGAKSLVKSLWKINDKATAQLMNYFYEELSEGKEKDEALKNAKLRYLNSTDDDLLKHPYYWAAFVVSGDTAEISKNYNLLFAVLAALLVISILILVLRRFRSN